MNNINSFMDFNSKFFLEINGKGILTWYAVCILTGIVIAAILGIKEAKRFGLSANFILDGVLICVPLSIVGARLYYVAFAFDEFRVAGDAWQTFLNILGFTPEGFMLQGLSITGGVIVAVIFVIVYCLKLKKNALVVFDFLAPGLLVGQICGRWGNFFNQEAHGGPISDKTLAWLQYVIPPFILKKMDYYDPSLGEQALWHPTFLYEGLWNTVGLIIILINRRINKKLRIGDSICFYLMWYGLGRALLIEPFRMDPLMLGSIRINIFVPLIFVVIGLVWILLKHLKFKDPYYLDMIADYQANKVDGVIMPIEDVLVKVDPLLKNAYYYTLKEYQNREVSEEELDKIITSTPEKIFANNLDHIAHFWEYFQQNYAQLVKRDGSKDLFKAWFKMDLGVVVVTKYSKEFAEYVLDMFNISTYVSIIISNDLTSAPPYTLAKEALPHCKNVMMICDSKQAINEAVKQNLIVCNYRNVDEASNDRVKYSINKLIDLVDIIV